MLFREWNRVTKIKVFAHTLSCSPQSKSEQMVKQITSTKIICGDLEHITSTRILLVTSTKIICGDLEHITSTKMLLVTSSRSPRADHLDQDIIGHLDQNNMWWHRAHHLDQDVIGRLDQDVIGHLEQITSTRILLVTSIRIICGDLEHITSTRMLLVTSTRMLLVTSTRKLPESTIQSKHFLRNIRDHILSGLKISSFLENSRGEDKNCYNFL